MESIFSTVQKHMAWFEYEMCAFIHILKVWSLANCTVSKDIGASAGVILLVEIGQRVLGYFDSPWYRSHSASWSILILTVLDTQAEAITLPSLTGMDYNPPKPQDNKKSIPLIFFLLGILSQ